MSKESRWYKEAEKKTEKMCEDLSATIQKAEVEFETNPLFAKMREAEKNLKFIRERDYAQRILDERIREFAEKNIAKRIGIYCYSDEEDRVIFTGYEANIISQGFFLKYADRESNEPNGLYGLVSSNYGRKQADLEVFESDEPGIEKLEARVLEMKRKKTAFCLEERILFRKMEPRETDYEEKSLWGKLIGNK